MKYAVLNPDSTVAYIFPEIDPLRATIPVDQLYSPSFLASCVKVDDTVVVESGYIYDASAGTFTVPVQPQPQEIKEANG